MTNVMLHNASAMDGLGMFMDEKARERLKNERLKQI